MCFLFHLPEWLLFSRTKFGYLRPDKQRLFSKIVTSHPPCFVFCKPKYYSVEKKWHTVMIIKYNSTNVLLQYKEHLFCKNKLLLNLKANVRYIHGKTHIKLALNLYILIVDFILITRLNICIQINA